VHPSSHACCVRVCCRNLTPGARADAHDVPAQNLIGDIVEDEVVFASERVEFVGQVRAAVIVQ
jgi:xanthine dehydrogenase molybdopterin-binding subunit B